ncbi:MAG: nitroreductase family protein [Desulfobacterota bacterium]|nr:nitroreductase family protein [Thermodesulfobacteriota bacterium]
MELMEAILGRRSIRSYRPDPVPEDVLLYILEAARWAPSWANTQCWEFIIVRDAAIKNRLAQTLPEKNPARSACTQAPIIIVACGRKGLAGFFKNQPVTDKGDWLMFDVALALQNLTLAAYEKGLGTVHVGFFDSRQVEAILQVPPDITVVELMPVGYPEGYPHQTARKPIMSYVFYETYGQHELS